jgi:hypothetical protein
MIRHNVMRTLVCLVVRKHQAQVWCRGALVARTCRAQQGMLLLYPSVGPTEGWRFLVHSYRQIQVSKVRAHHIQPRLQMFPVDDSECLTPSSHGIYLVWPCRFPEFWNMTSIRPGNVKILLVFVLVSYLKCQFCTPLMHTRTPEVLNQHFEWQKIN